MVAQRYNLKVAGAGFKVLRTARLEETQALYGEVHGQLHRMYASLPRGGRAGAEPLLAYTDWTARCKESTCQTLRDVWIQMLLAAPGAGICMGHVLPLVRLRVRACSPPRCPSAKLHLRQVTVAVTKVRGASLLSVL